jgi:hypothetical protein
MSRTAPSSLRTATGRARACGVIALVLVVGAAPACGGDDDNSAGSEGTTTAEAAEAAQESPDPGSCTAEVDHPLVALASQSRWVFDGHEREEDTGETIQTRGVMRLQDETATVGGFPVSVVEVTEYEDDELVERTLDYYSQCDGSVWYVGEKVDDYEDGKVAGHEGQWQAGEEGAEPGLFMPAEPKVGVSFEQERAPGVAEDRSTVVADGLDVKTPAGAFHGCIKTKDFAPIDKLTEFKFYCPDVGLVREQGSGLLSDLVRYT